MRKLSSRLAGQQSGFTLIELVIVIVIIGILAAVAIPQFAAVTDDANKGVANAFAAAAGSAAGTHNALCKNPGSTEAGCGTALTCASALALVQDVPSTIAAGAGVNPACTVVNTPANGTAQTSSTTYRAF